MSILDQLGGGSGMLRAVSGLVDKAGGLQGILGKLEASGLGDQVKSWIAADSNQQVSAQQIQQSLGDDEVEDVARQAGVSKDEAASGIADLLPQLVDKVSPDGKLPDIGNLDDAVKGFLGRSG